MSANCYVSYKAALAQLQIEQPFAINIETINFTTQVQLAEHSPWGQLWVHSDPADGEPIADLEFCWSRDHDRRDALERFFAEHSIPFRVVY